MKIHAIKNKENQLVRTIAIIIFHLREFGPEAETNTAEWQGSRELVPRVFRAGVVY